MEKQGIFSKINELYTNATKVIIGDMPLDGSPEAEAKIKSNANTKKKSLKEKLYTVKNNLLNLGKPNDEKSLLYDEVVKREKQKNKETKKAETKTKATTVKKTSPKKDVAKKSETNKTSLATKVTSTKKKTDTAKKVSTKRAATPKTSPVKTVEKETETKKTTSKTKATPTKKKTIKVSASTTKTKNPTKTVDKKTPSKKSTTKKTETKKNITKSTATKKPVTKKSVLSKNATDDKKKTSSKKSAAAPRGAKKAAKIALYIQDIKKHYGEVDKAFVAIIVKNLGPSIYKTDAELVSCSDPKELDTVRKNFLVKKLGIDASKGVLDAAIQDVCIELKGVRRKYRATFYYALAKKFKKESVLS